MPEAAYHHPAVGEGLRRRRPASNCSSAPQPGRLWTKRWASARRSRYRIPHHHVHQIQKDRKMFSPSRSRECQMLSLPGNVVRLRHHRDSPPCCGLSMQNTGIFGSFGFFTFSVRDYEETRTANTMPISRTSRPTHARATSRHDHEAGPAAAGMLAGTWRAEGPPHRARRRQPRSLDPGCAGGASSRTDRRCRLVPCVSAGPSSTSAVSHTVVMLQISALTAAVHESRHSVVKQLARTETRASDLGS